MATTPVRNKGSELSNESPLPTPPQAMHDLMSRTAGGRNAGRTSGPRSSIGNRRHDEVDAGGELRQAREPSSPSERAAVSLHRERESSAARRLGQRPSAERVTSRSIYDEDGGASSSRPSTNLATSMGTSAARYSQRSALGAQLGIRSEADHHYEAGAEKQVSSRRPSLGDRGRRTASYESSGSGAGSTGRQDVALPSPLYTNSGSARDVGEISPRHNGNADGDKENSMYEKRYSGKIRNGDIGRDNDQLHDATSQYQNHARNSYTARPKDLYRRTSVEAAQENNTHRDTLIGGGEESHQARSMQRGDRSPQLINGNPNPRGLLSDEAAALATSSRHGYQTPSMSTAARGLRSGQGARMNAAPWSVGRSIKRIDRHIAPDKPPQRIAAQEAENEDEDEEEAATHLPSVNENDGAEDDDNVGDAPRRYSPPETMPEASSSAQRRSRVNAEHFAGHRQAVEIPLGADEEDEEEEAAAASQRPTRRTADGVRKTVDPVEADTGAQQRRRTAMNDILAAKLPQGANGIRRALPQQQVGNVLEGQLQQAARWPSTSPNTTQAEESAVTSISDFLALVRREAAQQKGQPFIEHVLAKPSKDLETKFNGFKFKKIRKAGEGGFSTVWVVRGPTSVPDAAQPSGYVDVPESEQALFAMKQVTLKKMEKISRDEVVEECHVLQSLAAKPDNEDYILRFFGWKSSTGSLKILIELGEHDFNHILRSQRLSRTQIVTYWYQMLQAVHFTHEEGNIVHTDLKPANFLMANGRLKLIDFGIAQKIPVGTIHIKRDAMIGTPNYMAPETVRAVKEAATGHRPTPSGGMANGHDADPKTVRVYKAGKASDVWALGCILYQMVYCRPPFEGFHGDDKLREILNPKHRIEFPETRYGPSRVAGQEQTSSPSSQHQNDAEDEGVLESVDADLLDAMRLTLTYSATERATIPRLFEHPLLRPLEEQRRADLRRRNAQQSGQDGTSVGEQKDDGETVRMTRAELKDILRKMYTYARNGELREDNLDARSDALFDNVRKRQQVQ